MKCRRRRGVRQNRENRGAVSADGRGETYYSFHNFFNGNVEFWCILLLSTEICELSLYRL